jgi:hypothetical protein
LDHLQTIEHLLPVVGVVGVVLEIALDVRQAKERDGADMVQARHAIELRLDGHGDLALHFLSGPARVLGNDLDRRWRRIGIRLDIERLKGIQATDEEHD